MFELTIKTATLEEMNAIVSKLTGDLSHLKDAKPGKPQATTPPKTTSGSASPPEERSEPAATTPDQAKVDGGGGGATIETLLAAKPEELTSADLRGVAAGSLTKEQFSKLGMKFAKRMADEGASAKAIWKNYKQADGSAIAGFGTTQPGDYAAMIGEWADALAEAEMS